MLDRTEPTDMLNVNAPPPLIAVIAMVLGSTAIACGSGAGPSLDEILAQPVIANGCPLGWEVSRRTVDRSPVASASVALTCGTDASAESVFERVDTLLGDFEGKTPWAGPARFRGLTGDAGGSPMASSYFFWQPADRQVEVRVLVGSEVPAGGRRARTTYRVTVQPNPFAR